MVLSKFSIEQRRKMQLRRLEVANKILNSNASPIDKQRAGRNLERIKREMETQNGNSQL